MRRTQKFYRVADSLTFEERQRFRLKYGFGMPSLNIHLSNIRAIYTGEKRAPKKGEWYLSGGPVTAWRAPNDLTMVFHIARLVKVRKVEHLEIVADDYVESQENAEVGA